MIKNAQKWDKHTQLGSRRSEQNVYTVHLACLMSIGQKRIDERLVLRFYLLRATALLCAEYN